MGAATLTAPGVRIWHVSGLAATVTSSTPDGLHARIDGEPTAVPVTDGWVLGLACEYCDRPAQVQLRDGQPGDVLCRDCAGDHFEQPAAWVRPIPRTVIRALHGQCERLN